MKKLVDYANQHFELITILVLNVDYVTNVTYVLIYLGYTDVEKTRYLSRVYILDILTYSKVWNNTFPEKNICI